MTLIKRLFSYGLIGAAAALCAQAACFVCLLSEVLAEHFLQPCFLIALWPNHLLYYLFYQKRPDQESMAGLVQASLTSLAGWIAVACLIALVCHWMMESRRPDQA